MKIAIDCADLDYGRIDGTRIYVKNLLDVFGFIDNENKFYLYHKRSFNRCLKPRFFVNYIERKRGGFFWTQLIFPFLIWKDEIDLVWMPIQQIPFFNFKKVKFVITVHDLAFKYFPNSFPKKDLWKHNIFLYYALRRANKIIAVSESTKRDVLKFYPFVDENKIKVIHHGFDKESFLKKVSPKEKVKVLKKYKLISQETKIAKFLLYVGAIQPRKNLLFLLESFEKMKEKTKFKDLNLVLIGAAAWKSEDIIERFQKSQYKKDIILTGGVSFEDLLVFYQSASLFVFPSLYEGFGIPVLEALASSLPVVSAKNSSLTEVGGAVVNYFDTNNLDDFVRKIEASLLKRKAVIREAEVREHLGNFSWIRCAKETLKVIKS